MEIIKSNVTKYVLFASLFTILVIFNSNKALAEGQGLVPKGYVDVPLYGSTIKGDSVVSGWFLDPNGVSKIEILVDGKGMGEAEYGLSRKDVLNAFPEYENANSGYKFVLNTRNLSNGKHSLSVRETGKSGETTILSNVSITIQNPIPRGYMDTPSNGSIVRGDIPVNGWFLDSNGVAKIEILVDGKSMGVAEYGSARTDVSSAYPEYQNANSGYKFTLNTMNLSNGQHYLTVKETSNIGSSTTLEKISINIQNPMVKGYMDTPGNGSTIKGNTRVSGWFLDASGVAKIEVMVDGKSMGVAEYGSLRSDVSKAYPEYHNTNSGYQFTLDTMNLVNGPHTITVRETGRNGLSNTLDNVMVNVQNPTTRGYLDTPGSGSTIQGDVPISGWFLDSSGVSKIEVMLDGKSMGIADYGIARKDVFQAFPEYRNENSGYKFVLNTRNVTNGRHTLTIKETGINGAVNELAIPVEVKNLPVIGSIDGPAQGSLIKGQTTVSGWFLDDSGVSKIEVLVDGKLVGEASYGSPRADVLKAYPKYQNSNSGYTFTLNTRTLMNGQHTLTVREIGQNGARTELTNVINVQNLLTKGSIDSPSNNSTISGTLTVNGWFLDVSDVSKIEVFVDGVKVGDAAYGSERQDVAKVYPEYNNLFSGFTFSFDTQSLSSGMHTLTVKETGKNGSTLAISNTILKNPYLSLDLRKPSNITARDIESFFARSPHPDSPLRNYAQYFIDAQTKYGVNAQYLVAHSIWETGWGKVSSLLTYKNNLFGYGAYDPCPFTCGNYFPTVGDAINFEAYIVRLEYLDETGRNYNGPDLTGMNVKYATDDNWKNGIGRLMESIKPYDANYYSRVGVQSGSAQAAPSFGREIPDGLPYPTDIIIDYPTEKYATVTTDSLALRSIPYTMASALISRLSSGTVVKVIGYNTDVKVVDNPEAYPYDKPWYRILVNGQEGWVYGGGITFN